MMTDQKPRSLQDISDRRRQNMFVGREDELAFFNQNLRLSIDDDRRYFVINIHGQGGVGKTWLLRQFRKQADEIGNITAYIEDTNSGTVGIMGQIAVQFYTRGRLLKEFSQRYRIYQQRRRELETDRNAPLALAAYLTRTAVGSGCELTMLTSDGMISGSVVDDAFSEQARELANFVHHKLDDKDEVQLVLDPMRSLTPCFLADLRNIADEHTIALFFDNYEETGVVIDAWLRNLLEGRYGDVPPNILFGIAGRRELDSNSWNPQEGLIIRLRLEPFTEDEARRYLARKGITDEQVVAAILKISERLPILLATLTATRPEIAGVVTDPSSSAVELFLRSIADPMRRQLALNCALPRHINRDVVAQCIAGSLPRARTVQDDSRTRLRQALTDLFDQEELRTLCFDMQLDYDSFPAAGKAGKVREIIAQTERHGDLSRLINLCQQLRPNGTWNDISRDVGASTSSSGNSSPNYLPPNDNKTDALFEWLRRLPFVEEHAQGQGYRYHPVVREMMLRYKRRETPHEWNGLHARLMDYYREMRDGLQLTEETGMTDETWRSYSLEAYYHRLCQPGHAPISQALNNFLVNLHARRDIAIMRPITQRWAEAMHQAGEDAGVKELELWGERLSAGLKAYEEGPYELAIELFTALLVHPAIETSLLPLALGYRGNTYRRMRRYNDALNDLNKAIEMTPTLVWAIASRAATYRLMGNLELACEDFNRAIELDPNYAPDIARRGNVLAQMGRYEQALLDFDKAVRLAPNLNWILVGRGDCLRLTKCFTEALADLDRAIGMQQDDGRAYACRGRVHLALGNLTEAAQDFEQAIRLDARSAWAHLGRGRLYEYQEDYAQALEDFGRATTLEPDNVEPLISSARIRAHLDRYGDALDDLNRAIRIAPRDLRIYTARGQVHLALQEYTLAINDLSVALDLGRASDFFRPERGHESVSEETKEHSHTYLDSESAKALRYRAEALRRLGRDAEATADLDLALQYDPNDVWTLVAKGELLAAHQQYEPAIAIWNQAFQVDSTYDWSLYDRGTTYLLLGETTQGEGDLRQAIQLASARYKASPRQWANRFNLSLYYLAADDADESLRLCREVLSENPPQRWIHEAIYDMEYFLALFPSRADTIPILEILGKAKQGAS